MASSDSTRLHDTMFYLTIAELVRQNRESFQPLWTTESWVKLLIWLSLNCGSSGDEAGMARFVEALGPSLTTRMRRVFFERELDALDLQVMALPMGPGVPLDVERAAAVIEQVQLQDHVVADRERWQQLDAVVAIPRLEAVA